MMLVLVKIHTNIRLPYMYGSVREMACVRTVYHNMKMKSGHFYSKQHKSSILNNKTIPAILGETRDPRKS